MASESYEDRLTRTQAPDRRPREASRHFTEISLEFIQGFPLTVGARPPGNRPDKKPVSGSRSTIMLNVRMGRPLKRSEHWEF
jgi:hypothetical protein